MGRSSKHELSDEDEGSLPSPPPSHAKRARVNSSLPSASPPPLSSDAEGGDASGSKANGSDGQSESGSGEDSGMEEETPPIPGNVKQARENGVNFLCGNNGSGKSAVLTGITIGLGGNARVTNRAQKGADFIKTGASFAVCTVKLRNEGSESYQQNVYGKCVIVERRITKDGGGGYKIKNAAGKTIDTKKATLDAILDHFNVQVDNPMTVLTQDQSRQFLANSTPRDKYDFFLQGTQLAQLTEEYEAIRANFEMMSDALERKKEVLPELETACKCAKKRWNEAQAAIDKQKKLDVLKDELTWVHVGEMEFKINRGRQILDEEAARGPEIEEAYNRCLTMAEEARTEVAGIEQAQRDQTDQGRDDEILNLQKTIKNGYTELKDRSNQFRGMSTEQKRLESGITAYQAQIADEKKKQELNTDSQRRSVLDEITKVEDLSSKVGVDITRTREERKDLDDRFTKAKDELDRANEQVRGAEQEATKFQDRVRHLQHSKSNPLSNYGTGVPQLQNLINRDQSWTKKPIGPVGTHVKLLDAKYANVLESFFAESLNMLTPDSSFDCSSGEPEKTILTIWRVLNISNGLVFQALVDQKGIEKAALVERRAMGDELVRHNPYNVQGVYSADRFKVGGSAQSSSTIAMDAWRGLNRLNPDVASKISAAQARFQKIQAGVNDLALKRDAIDHKMAQIHHARLAVDRLANRTDQLNDKLQQDEPSDVVALEEALQDQMKELNSYISQIELFKEATRRKHSELDPLVKRREELQAQAAAADRNFRKLGDVKNAEVALKKNAQKRTTHTATLVSHQAEVTGFEMELQNRQGATPDEIAAEYEKCRRVLREAEIACKELGQLCSVRPPSGLNSLPFADLVSRWNLQALKLALTARIERWTHFRDTISDRAIGKFLFFLQCRNFTGKLHIDHEKCKIFLRVQTDEVEVNGQRKRQKDAKSLSGGEKSFSTICLLLAMWEGVGCPVRCLDEFDVFMDGVNRRISMGMIAKAAKATDNAQFILITPQSVNSASMKWGPEPARKLDHSRRRSWKRTDRRAPARGTPSTAMTLLKLQFLLPYHMFKMSLGEAFPTNYLSAHPRHGVPRAAFIYSAPLRAPNPLTISLRVPAERVKGKYSHYVWNAGLLMSDKITAGELDLQGKTVLELGAGAGLPGIVAAKSGAAKVRRRDEERRPRLISRLGYQVVLSDYDDEGMRVDLERNVREALNPEERERTHVIMHSWGENPSRLQEAGPFDLVLAADVVWDVPMHTLLISTLKQILSPSSEVVLIVGNHTGRAVVRQFIEAAKDAGLEMIGEDSWEEVSVEGEKRLWSKEARFGEDLESQEGRAKWVLEARMRLPRK
ncbi:structural maintenance of chromosomes protein 6, partial [Phenoliferia sp. Uapishka_3]